MCRSLEQLNFDNRYEPVLLFPDGKPSNQLNIIIGFSATGGAILFVWIILGLFEFVPIYYGRIPIQYDRIINED